MKHAPSRTYSKHNAQDSAKREVEPARIKQSLQGVTHESAIVIVLSQEFAWRSPISSCMASVPIPKFATVCGTL
jgi:hypothetical protein